MSVKRIEERICVPKNEVLEKKLQEITKYEKIDNYSLNMISDNYGFSLIYAISGMVLVVVELQERWCGFKTATQSHFESSSKSYQACIG